MADNRYTTLIDEDHHRDVPHELRSVAREWFDGEKSAMYAFSMQRPASSYRLAKETRTTLDDLTPSLEKWRPRLEALLAFAEAHQRKAKAYIALEKALATCAEAGVDLIDFNAVARTVYARVERERPNDQTALPQP